MIMAPPLSVIKIVQYCGQKCNAHKQYNCILPVSMQLTLVSYKILSVSLRSVHGNNSYSIHYSLGINFNVDSN